MDFAISQDFQRNITCGLCYKVLDDPMLYESCDHSYCRRCLMEYRKSCIICKKIYNENIAIPLPDRITRMAIEEWTRICNAFGFQRYNSQTSVQTITTSAKDTTTSSEFPGDGEPKKCKAQKKLRKRKIKKTLKSTKSKLVAKSLNLRSGNRFVLQSTSTDIWDSDNSKHEQEWCSRNDSVNEKEVSLPTSKAKENVPTREIERVSLPTSNYQEALLLPALTKSTKPKLVAKSLNLRSGNRFVLQSTSTDIWDSDNSKQDWSSKDDSVNEKEVSLPTSKAKENAPTREIERLSLPTSNYQEALLLPALTQQQEDKIQNALLPANHNQVLVKKFKIEIKGRDISTLKLNVEDQSAWLNDVVVNFYMKLLMTRGENPSYPKVYAMDTFFIPRLSTSGYRWVSRWTRKVDIFSMDFLIVPVHLPGHWCMCIANFKDKTIVYYDSLWSHSNRTSTSILHLVQRYLEEESIDKRKIATTGWIQEYAKDVPQQKNSIDCGVFACMFAEFVTRNAGISFRQEDIPYLRRKMIIEILEQRILG